MRTLHSSFLFMATALQAHATTYHVATGGNNANNGLTLATAFGTIQHAADVAFAGDSVLVHQGNYQGFAAMDNSGTAGAPIVFMGIGAVNITTPCTYNDLDGINIEGVAWVVVEGFTVNDMPRTGIRTVLSDNVTIRYNSCHSNYKWGILTGFAEHVIIEYNTCSGSEDEHGIYFGNSADDPIIRYNHCFDNVSNGIHMNGDQFQGGDGIISNAQVYGNIIHGNGVTGGSGINCDGVINSVIFNNLLYDNHSSGISLYQIDGGAPSTNNKVYNNTIINADDARWCVNITDGCTGNQVLNNILINLHPWRGSIVIAEDALAGFISDFNIVINSLSPDGDATILDLAAWQALGYDANSLVAAPLAALFINSAAGDLHTLNAIGQQVDAGTSAVSPFVTNDLDLMPRPVGGAYDIGCYEFDPSNGLTAMVHGSTTMTIASNGLQVIDAPAGSLLQVHDTAGRTLLHRRIDGGARSFPLPGRGPWLCVLYDARSGSSRSQWFMAP